MQVNQYLRPLFLIFNCQTPEKLKEAHFKRIELSDAILVIDIDGYIGYSTNLEIEYAKNLEKEIIYYTDLRNLVMQ